MNDDAETIRQIRNQKPVQNNLTWLRHRADSEAGLIDQMILKGTFNLEMMIYELHRGRVLTPKSRTAWKNRIKNHLLHLSTVEGDRFNQISGTGGHNLRIKTSSGAGAICLDYL